METDMTDVRSATDDELEAQIVAAQQLIEAAQREKEARLALNREKVLAEVQANVRKYKITRTELAPYFPQIRKSKSPSTDTNSGTQAKRRGRPKKVRTAD